MYLTKKREPVCLGSRLNDQGIFDCLKIFYGEAGRVGKWIVGILEDAGFVESVGEDYFLTGLGERVLEELREGYD